MGALAALATLALVGTGAAGAFAATTIPQSDATSEDAPAVAMVADDVEAAAVTTEDATIEAPAEEAVTEPPADPTPAPAPEVPTPTDTTAPTPTETSKPSGEGEIATTTDQLETDTPAKVADAQSDDDDVMLLAEDCAHSSNIACLKVNKVVVGGSSKATDWTFTVTQQKRTSTRNWWGGWGWGSWSNAQVWHGLKHEDSIQVEPGYQGSDAGSGRVQYLYTVTEDEGGPPGYVPTSSGCSNVTATNNVTRTCTYTNTETKTQPLCTAGYIYSMQESGQMKQVSPTGGVTNIGSAPSTGSTFNGLGIGYGGQPVFAYARGGEGNSSSNVSIYKYDVTNGTWTDTGHNVNSSANGSVTFVAGAVNLDTGRYFLGGYSGTDNNRVFRLWEYNPATNTSVYKGYISATGDGASNGDIAFDAQGTLFVIRGAGSTTTIYSVTAANLAAANGGLISSSASTAVSNTTSNVNGVAFDSSGKGFLGSGGTLQSYNMPGWSGQSTVTSDLVNSTDLASCGSPPTIVIEKEIIGGRVNSGDQFRMTLNQGTTLLGEATTTGTATGLQGQRVGPLPTVRNVALNFAEHGANGANLGNYASAYQCTVTHRNGTVENLQQVNATSGSITIPSTGEAVRCVFRNSPLVANVTINKQVTDALGLNPQPESGWTVGASTAATTGTATQAPTAATQTTNTAGNAAWAVTFGAYGDRATVTVSEDVTSKPGYQFLSGQCVVTGLDGSTATTELNGPTATALTGVKPGDQVNCTYVNKPIPGTLAITKAFDSSVPSGSGNIEFTGAYSCVLPASSSTVVASGTWSRTGTGAATLTPAAGTPAVNQIPAGASCSVTENQPTGSTGLPNSSYEWDTYSVSGPVTIAANETGTVTVTNKAKRVYGNFSVTKVVPEGSVVASDMTFGGTYTCTLGTAPNVETKTGNWGPVAPGATWRSTDAAQIPLGANCVATETRAANPVTDGSHVWDGDPVITPENGVAATNATTLNLITVTNKTKPVLGSVTWNKVDDTDAKLSGSEWTLKGPGVNGPTVPVSDCTASTCTGPDKDPAAGQFQIVDLLWGDYTLTETKAPAGFYPIAQPIYFTIGAGDNLIKVLGDVENTRIDGPVLPLTGGISRDAFIIGGLSVLVLGLGTAGTIQFRNRRKEVA